MKIKTVKRNGRGIEGTGLLGAREAVERSRERLALAARPDERKAAALYLRADLSNLARVLDSEES